MNFQVTSKYHMICDCVIPSTEPQTNDQTNLITSFIYGNKFRKFQPQITVQQSSQLIKRNQDCFTDLLLNQDIDYVIICQAVYAGNKKLWNQWMVVVMVVECEMWVILITILSGLVHSTQTWSSLCLQMFECPTVFGHQQTQSYPQNWTCFVIYLFFQSIDLITILVWRDRCADYSTDPDTQQ